ncbi:hypothetical protein OICFNHDK_0357 [Methylobacterium bullatum]|uniref:Abortive phage infection protein C-terminal domain-containing protein n=2 Tax=Methylobacterium bullatum TaxID=570505 RepID=A0AAV4Z2J2_9HYPH|nr:hypothetical protein OICFNHDK_0357 [Methylobacterium bullatum]
MSRTGCCSEHLTPDLAPCRPRYPHDTIGDFRDASVSKRMAISVDYPELLDNFPEYLSPIRSASAAFLIWYLEQYYRLEQVEAEDAVCDQGGDKGVDGIFINDSNLTITVFQSKISHKTNSTVGDATLRGFLGTLQQFKSAEAVTHLMENAGNAQIVQLIKRSDLLSKIGTYELRGEFVTNIDLDHNGSSFLKHYGNDIKFIGRQFLIDNHISDERNLPKQKPATFDVYGIGVAEHVAGGDVRAIIAPIRARELVLMDGISDQSLFAYNVRGPLGRTSVNKDVVATINDSDKHKLFPLFHNGITVIAQSVKQAPDKIEISGYYVVNGCQSITSLYNNKEAITDDLKLLTKFIEMDPSSPTATLITEYSNNQNGVRSRDFKSNNKIQIRLRTEFAQHYDGVYSYEIKRGETPSEGESIPNEEAGLYMMAFDQKEPWGTHRKYEVFEDRHAALFGRPEVSADRIVMLRLIDNEIVNKLVLFRQGLIAKYKLTRYMIMYIFRELLNDDKKFNEIINNPEKFMRDAGLRKRFCECIGGFIGDIIVDIDVESRRFGTDFDYRGKVKDAEWVKSLASSIQKDYEKNVIRGRQDTFEMEWNK